MLALINDGILDPGDKVLTFDYMVSCVGKDHDVHTDVVL